MMNRIFIFLSVVALFASACTPKVVQETITETTTSTITTIEGDGYETAILKGDIASPKKEMRTMVGKTKMTIGYGSPSVKDRTIWGNVVPYGKVWRTGANEASTFEASGDLQIQGKKLPAGKYGLFTIPMEDGKWTVIFNSEADQWGAYKYDVSKDVLRVPAKAKTAEGMSETMEFIMSDGILILKWGNLDLPIEITE